MDDLQAIELIEALRARLLEEAPSLRQRLERAHRTNLATCSLLDLQERLVEVAAAQDPFLPGGFRSIRRIIAAASGPGAGGSLAPIIVADPPAADPELIQSLEYLAALETAPEPTSARISEAPFATEAGTAFARQLLRSGSPAAAARLTTENLPALKGLAPYTFLATIGYPIAVPHAETRRMFRRLGLTTEASDPKHHKFLEAAGHCARLSGSTLPEIDILFAAYSGALRAESFTPICATKPRCEICSVRPLCPTGNSTLEAAVPADEQPAPAPPMREVTQKPVRPARISRPIHSWAHDERPRERLIAGERLTTAELLAIILRTGSGNASALELGRELLHEFGSLHELEKASPTDICTRMAGKGIGPAKAAEIRAAIELGRRVVQPAADNRDGLRPVGSSRDIFDLYRTRYKTATQEEFLLLILNTKNRIQREVSVSTGTLNSSIVHPRDVFNHALREAAAAVIFIHNHPSGDPTPSPEDHALTRRLAEAGKLLGIRILDHVIIGAQRYYSFSDEGQL